MMAIVGCTYGLLNKLKNKVTFEVLIIMGKKCFMQLSCKCFIKKKLYVRYKLYGEKM